MKKILYVILIAFATVASAQTNSKDIPTIIAPSHDIQFSWRGGQAIVPVKANNDYVITGIDSTWLSVTKAKNSILLKTDRTSDANERSLTLTLATSDGKFKRSFLVSQEADRSFESLRETEIMPLTKTASSTNSGEGVERLFDKDVNTLWHSTYAGGVSASNPVTLTFTFDGTNEIDYMVYTPRPSNMGTNGVWLGFSIAITSGGKTTTTQHTNSTNNNPVTIDFPEGTKPSKVVITITSGAGGYASGAELGFFRKADPIDDVEIFADDVLSELKPGTTQADIDALDNLFCKNLAQTLYDGNYDKNYRVAQYPCRLSYNVLSNEWNAPDKRYSQIDNPTGIHFQPNDSRVVVVSGIPDDMTATLAIVAWYIGKDGKDFDGADPHTSYFTLHNGINAIDYTYPWGGLAYIQYYANTRARYEQGVPDIKVHIVNGRVNGILTPDKSNAEMQEICKNAAANGNICLDVYGKKVQSVWTSAGLRDYCKASDGKSLGYRQFMNVLDTLVQWEHRELGLEKYNRIPENHTLAYTNYTYYMFQGGLGVSFHHNQESRVLNCRTLMLNDDDVIWGLSHEWGHQHQMTPYMCWAGQSEVTNNIFSYYNIMHMGYTYYRKGWSMVRQYMFGHAYPASAGFSKMKIGLYDYKITSTGRHLAYVAAKSNTSLYSYSTGLRNQCLAEVDSVVYRYAANPERSLSFYDLDSEDMTGAFLLPSAFIKLYIHRDTKEWSKQILTDKGYLDFYPDLFEAMRQSDTPVGNGSNGGSMIEKQDGFDKYELIAAAQNGNKNNLYSTLRQKYPESIWSNEDRAYNYLNKGNVNYKDNSVPFAMNFVRKASRLIGYNLLPFFEEYGMFRIGAWQLGDYGTKYYVLTREMLDEFRADMNALVEAGTIKEMPEGMLNAILNTRELNNSKTDRTYSTPEIPN